MCRFIIYTHVERSIYKRAKWAYFFAIICTYLLFTTLNSCFCKHFFIMYFLICCHWEIVGFRSTHDWISVALQIFLFILAPFFLFDCTFVQCLGVHGCISKSLTYHIIRNSISKLHHSWLVVTIFWLIRIWSNITIHWL